MTTYDNAPPPSGWALPRRCCGTWCEGYACTVCGEYRLPTGAVLGDN